VARHLRDADVTLPGGARLTVEAFQALGQVLGASTGSDALHYLLEDPFAGSELSDSFLHRAQSRLNLRQSMPEPQSGHARQPVRKGFLPRTLRPCLS
jgi:hypothetical protein